MLYHKTQFIGINLIELITSKEFIDSIVNYLKNNRWLNEMIDRQYVKKRVKTNMLKTYIEKQAFAIYNNDLESFFKSIIE